MKNAFDDILNRVDKLSGKTSSQEYEKEQERAFSSNIANDLSDVFRSSEHLFKKKSVPAGAQNLLFGEKGIVLRVAPPTLVGGASHGEGEVDEELGEETNAEAMRLAAERAFMNTIQMSLPQPSLTPARKGGKDAPSTSSATASFYSSKCTQREAIFGEKMKKFVRGGRRRNVDHLFMEAVRESGTEGDLMVAWEEVMAMYGKPIDHTTEFSTTATLIERATNYLHTTFTQYMRSCVERSREQAEMGGVPGTRSLVNAFLKVSADTADISPWAVAYHCLRAGDPTAASGAFANVSDFARNAVLVSALNQLTSSARLTDEVKQKLKTEWRHENNSLTDTYQIALYSALLGVDSPIANNLDNWLWFRLAALRYDPQLTPILYADLQKTIAIDFGEAYFLGGAGSSDSSSSWSHFFTALVLTGMPERAIGLLAESGHVVDAVHMAVLAHHHKLIRLAKITQDIVSNEPTHPTKYALNLARLVVGFTKKFELVDVARALDYSYVLKGIAGPQGTDVFEMAVSRAVYVSGDESLILGRPDANGRRTRALIDEYADIDPQHVLERVAADAEIAGATSDAIRIYVLAGNTEKAIQLCSGMLSQAIRSNHDVTEVAKIGQDLITGASDSPSSDAASCLCLLLDVSTVFRFCSTGKYAEIRRMLGTLKIIPTDTNEVTARLSSFHMLPAQVKDVLPDICLALMRLVVQILKDETVTIERAPIRRFADALLMFAASVPHQFPTHISAKLLELQASLP